jgi:glycosyltransferase involved in cell wall biosynthesis
VSERIKHSIEQIGVMVPITVLPIFVDVSRFQHARADEGLKARFAPSSHKVLVVARLEPEKNVALAIVSFAQITISDACLIIVGEGSERERLVQLVQSLNIADRVFFEGEQDPAPYFALADLVVVPSRYEGYGLVILEALAAGKPVLSTDVGIAREAGATIAEPKDFARALGTLLNVNTDYPHSIDISRYMYKDLEEYAQRYCNDIAACLP